MDRNSELGLRPIGFLDDDPTLINRTVDRIPVLGSGDDLASIVDTRRVSHLVISSTKINGDRLDKVIDLCNERKISVLRCQLHLEPIALDGNGAPSDTGVPVISDRLK